MWEPLQGLLASPEDDVKVQALWVIGTAVQNNPAAQKAVRSSSPILSYVSPLAQSSKQLRSKAIYALSGFLKHNAAALAPFDAADGWVALRGALSGTVSYPIHPPVQYSTTQNQFIPRAQTRTSASGARSCFSSTTSSYPPSQPLRVLLPVREYTEATSKRDQLCIQTRMRRWWPTLRRPTQRPRRCAPCARTVCCLCSCGS